MPEASAIGLPESDPRYAVVLPCDQEQFGSFVAGLLGKPQTVERSFYGTFELTPDDIVNTYHMVEQRIYQQNEATLIQFTLKVEYHDHSSVSHGSLDEFLHYREVRPLVPLAAHLSWVYLIKFQDKSVPEKQTVELSFCTDYIRASYARRASLRFQHPDGDIYLRIGHTARTWATDVESLIAGHVATLLKDESKFWSFLYSHSGILGLSFGILFMAIALVGSFFVSTAIAADQLTTVNEVLAGRAGHTIALGDKVDFLLTEYAKGTWPRFYFGLTWFVMIAVVAAILFGAWVGNSAWNTPRSFLLFTPGARELLSVYRSDRKRKYVMFFLSSILSVLTGVVANFVFAFVVSKWLVP